jgi:hypothetical protein
MLLVAGAVYLASQPNLHAPSSAHGCGQALFATVDKGHRQSDVVRFLGRKNPAARSAPSGLGHRIRSVYGPWAQVAILLRGECP